MFSTDKEVHIYITNAIQQIASNRKQAIAAQFLDMLLNVSMIEYIKSKFTSKTNPFGIQSTLEDYQDFNILKTSANRKALVDIENDRVYCKIPYNCLKLDNVKCSFKYPVINNETLDVSIFNYKLIIKNDIMLNNNGFYFEGSYVVNNETFLIKMDFDDLIISIKSKAGIFLLLNNILNAFIKYGIDAKIITDSIDTDEHIIIFSAPDHSQIGYNLDSIDASVTELLVSSPIFNNIPNNKKSVSVMTESNVSKSLDDYYSSRNLHNNPIAYIENNVINIAYTNFNPTSIDLTYFKNPKPFDIVSDSIPEIVITKDFLDYAVKNIMIILGSPQYNTYNNEINNNK